MEDRQSYFKRIKTFFIPERSKISKREEFLNKLLKKKEKITTYLNKCNVNQSIQLCFLQVIEAIPEDKKNIEETQFEMIKELLQNLRQPYFNEEIKSPDQKKLFSVLGKLLLLLQ
jgi:hypothetical protein